MAKIEEILKLIDAGYSKAEIESLTAETMPTAETAEAPQEAGEPAEVEKPAEVQANDNSEVLNKVLSELAEMKKAMQKRNLADTYTDTPKPDRSTEILAQLINPKKEGEK